jgi:hypothetical protein
MIEHKVVDAPHPPLMENNRLRAKNTYQQVQKNESGTNRIAASRLQQNLPHSAGADSVLLRGRAERISATRLPWKRVIDCPD